MNKFDFMQIALDEAKKAAAEGEVPVGAVITKNGRVISTGRNGREKGKNALLHAETCAIDNACKTLGGWRLEDCDLYVTLEPCPMCAGAIINSRIRKVYFGAFDNKAGSTGSIINLFELPYNHSPEYEGGILQDECSAILSDFFANLRDNSVKKKQDIKAVLIDIDNTLLDFRKCAEESIKQAFSVKKLEWSPNVFPVFEKINDSLWLEIEAKTLTIDGLHKIRWNKIFDALGIDEDGESFEWLFVENLHESCIPVEGARHLVNYLASKYTVCAASNATYAQQYNRLKKAGMLPYFKELFISEKIGYPKPTKEFFDECLKQLNITDKNKVVMIGDSLTADINGGADYGLYTIWYNHKKEPVPDNIKADVTVDRLTDIKKYI